MKSKNLLWKHSLPLIKNLFSINSYAGQYGFLCLVMTRPKLTACSFFWLNPSLKVFIILGYISYFIYSVLPVSFAERGKVNFEKNIRVLLFRSLCTLYL